MIKILNSAQFVGLNNCTIADQHIYSFDLMERAAKALFNEFRAIIDKKHKIVVFAGLGNNGGDALALARMLIVEGYEVEVYQINSDNKESEDCKKSRELLIPLTFVGLINKLSDISAISSDSVIIDGIFGVGLNRPTEGLHLEVIKRINQSGAVVYSIDLPSGLFPEDNTSNNMDGIVKATCVLTVQLPKLSLLLPHNQSYCDRFKILDINLSQDCLAKIATDYFFIQQSDIACRLKDRNTFSHKGTYGHVLLITGSYGKMGAAVLSSKACLRSGVGLLTVHIPKCGVDILQSVVPEAMVSVDQQDLYVSGLPDSDVSKFTIGIGPAIGEEKETHDFLLKLFELYDQPMVIDADAINLIAKSDLLKRKIPKNSILTPHPIEFDRLIGKKSENTYLRLQYARQFAQTYHINLLLKGAYSALILPDGKVYFNSTGNPGMATGGSGDTLTGIITSLLAQKYIPQDAMLIGAYIHGLAADLAQVNESQEALLPCDIIDNIGKAYLWLRKNKN